jgi:hypothetical protein
LFVVLVASGCGEKKGDVSGTITYHGKPLTVGNISFMDANNQVLGASPVTEGKYAMVKVPVGPVRIVIASTRRPGSTVQHPLLKAKDRPNNPKKGKSEDRPLAEDHSNSVISIPEKYSNPDRSGLTYTVQPGENTFDVDLK